jgi:hypothetical protein
VHLFNIWLSYWTGTSERLRQSPCGACATEWWSWAVELGQGVAPLPGPAPLCPVWRVLSQEQWLGYALRWSWAKGSLPGDAEVCHSLPTQALNEGRGPSIPVRTGLQWDCPAKAWNINQGLVVSCHPSTRSGSKILWWRHRKQGWRGTAEARLWPLSIRVDWMAWRLEEASRGHFHPFLAWSRTWLLWIPGMGCALGWGPGQLQPLHKLYQLLSQSDNLCSLSLI